MEKCTLWSIIKVSTGEYRVWKSIPFEGEWNLSKDGVKCYTDLMEVSNFAQFDKMVKGYLENYKHEENMGSIYTASEYKHPWVKSNGEICWDYRKGKHFDLFDTNLLIADYNFIKNLTSEDVTIKCRNGVFILPPYGVMVTEYNKCLNNRVNSENYEIDQLFRGEQKRASSTTAEVCPYCDQQVIIANTGISKCPNCGKWIVPCSMCIMEEVNCNSCTAEKIAKARNEQNSKGFVMQEK